MVIVGSFCSSTMYSVLIALLISLPRGDAGLMRRIGSPQHTQKIEQTGQSKSSIEGAEMEGALHHGLRNVKNANYP